MLNKYFSITIPGLEKLRNVVVKVKGDQINFINGINRVDSIGKIKKFNYNCHYIVLLPAESIFYNSITLAERNPYKVSEKSFMPKVAPQSEADFAENFYYDYLETVSESEGTREIKLFAVKRKLLDSLTTELDKHKNNYLVSALPVVIFAVINKILNKKNYLLYYKINKKYTLLTVRNNKLDLLQSGIKSENLQPEIDKTVKYYLNSFKLDLDLIEGSSKLLKLGKFIDLKADDFAFLTALFWSVNKC
ncbi:hypothetical protein [Halanaerobium salsuginis]|jgi:hypothetical protein|uniref:Uncharacterized protein n=1 Tax=Halanaerobium salsuginis TaxID=29563 RepID=A0A1I4EVB4_9FIRM|nr:hypothetical protein [Halanaerobium salsuginis]SFL09050.1 hypothetical protein SAMN02983006_00145 [Halanaerobium salsuginis]